MPDVRASSIFRDDSIPFLLSTFGALTIAMFGIFGNDGDVRVCAVYAAAMYGIQSWQNYVSRRWCMSLERRIKDLEQLNFDPEGLD